MDKPWTAYLVDVDGKVTLEFGLVCAALVLLAWIGVAMHARSAARRSAPTRVAS